MKHATSLILCARSTLLHSINYSTRLSSMALQEELVIIVGAGPAGLATAACLSHHSIPHIVLEREDCFASLWKKKSYDRLHLHLAKNFCELPFMSFPPNYPTFVPKKEFIQYLDNYVSHFKISPMYYRSVELAIFNEVTRKWDVKARNFNSNEVEEYCGKFLVVATGEMSEAFVPDVDGLSSFTGNVTHSTQYKCGDIYSGKNVLVIGSGNSGMEIALDLSSCGAKTSIVVRSPIHVLSREMADWGLALLKYIPLHWVDFFLVMFSKLKYGNLTKYGIKRPQEGPFSLKVKYGKYPFIDQGTTMKIKSREIQVLPALKSIQGEELLFENSKSYVFDTIVFATGFKRSTKKWLKGDEYLMNEDGYPKPEFPDHWKGENGLYCAGFARRLGLLGIGMDAQKIANDIKALM